MFQITHLAGLWEFSTNLGRGQILDVGFSDRSIDSHMGFLDRH